MNLLEFVDWIKEVCKFGKVIWDIIGKGVDVDIVFEYFGEVIFLVLCLVVK